MWQMPKATSHDKTNWTTDKSLDDHFRPFAETLIELGLASLTRVVRMRNGNRSATSVLIDSKTTVLKKTTRV